MPVKFGLWRIDDGGPVPVPVETIASEERLEELIEARIDILGLGRLLPIGRQLITDYGKRIDLLAIDAQGDLYVIELKKDRTPRDVVAQALEYGFWVQDLSLQAIAELYERTHEESLETAFAQHFETELPEAVNTAHRLVVVATGMDVSTEQIVEYVRSHGVPISVVFFQHLRDGERTYLARSWLSDPEVDVTARSARKRQAPWNGEDFFVAVGEGRHRNWDDMRRYGFVSAGHGEKYRKAMSNLFEGARVWAAIPGGVGYVGVGRVVAPAVGVADFTVEHEGASVPILDLPLAAPHMGEDVDDPEQSEYLARVRWIDTRPRERPVWEKGMFANQNVVAKLRQPFTLQRLPELFDLGDDRPPLDARTPS